MFILEAYEKCRHANLGTYKAMTATVTTRMMTMMMMPTTALTMMMTMKDANYKCRAQGGNASCIPTLALPLMQKELELLII